MVFVVSFLGRLRKRDIIYTKPVNKVIRNKIMSLKETLSRANDAEQNIERSSDEILADMIEKFVNNQNSTADRQGGNKKCYIANGYVL